MYSPLVLLVLHLTRVIIIEFHDLDLLAVPAFVKHSASVSHKVGAVTPSRNSASLLPVIR